MSLKETVYMSGIIKLRRGTAEELKGIVLALGEPAFEIDSYKLKIGDGETVYESLGYINDYDDLRKLLDEAYEIPQDLQEILNYLKENEDISALLGKINEIDTAQNNINQSLEALRNSVKEKDDNIEANLDNAINALENQDTQLQNQIDDTKNRIKAIEDLDIASKDYVNKTKSFLENAIESQIKGEPIVPINDIYNVFKSYWHARTSDGKPALAYSSMLVDAYKPNSSEIDLAPIIFSSPINPDKGDLEENLKAALANHNILNDNYTVVTEGGKHNGMYFGNSEIIPRYAVLSKATDRQEIEGKITTVVTGYNFKHGQPINCSTLSALLTLGIPYTASKYNNQEDYDIKELAETYGMKYSFNMYGADSKINKENYEAYFIARRQLARFRELGLEIPALSQDWWPKYKENEGWYDYIQPTSDLREAQPGDLVFWNTHGENLDPRDVTHVVMVLARLSYDSRNPNQPLLLLAEATSSADLGVQVSYYMYDVSDQKEMVEDDNNDSEVSKYIQLADPITDWRYIYDSDSGNYRFSPNTGDYIKIPHYKIKDDPNSYTSGDYVFVKLINNSFIEYTTEVQNACFEDPKDNELKLKYFDNPSYPNGGTEQYYHSLILKDNSPITYIIKRNVEGTRENRIPKFICRPKYVKTELGKTEGYSLAEELIEYNYSDNLTEGYAIDKNENDSLKITGAFIRSNPNNAEGNIKCGEVISLEFDWKTVEVIQNAPFNPDAVGEHYLSFRQNSNEDMLIHSIPYCLPNTKYEKVRFVIPLQSYLSSSKGNQIDEISDTIYIQEVVKDKNGNELYRNKPVFTNLKIYKGIIQT